MTNSTEYTDYAPIHDDRQAELELVLPFDTFFREYDRLMIRVHRNDKSLTLHDYMRLFVLRAAINRYYGRSYTNSYPYPYNAHHDEE